MTPDCVEYPGEDVVVVRGRIVRVYANGTTVMEYAGPHGVETLVVPAADAVCVVRASRAGAA